MGYKVKAKNATGKFTSWMINSTTELKDVNRMKVSSYEKHYTEAYDVKFHYSSLRDKDSKMIIESIEEVEFKDEETALMFMLRWS